MSSAFNAITTIKRAVADPITDDTLPPPGELSWTKINDPSALKSTTGVDCKLVHGDCQMTFEQDVKTTIDGGLTAYVGGECHRTIKGDEVRKNGGKVTSTFNGQVISTYNKPVTTTFMKQETEIHHESRHVQAIKFFDVTPLDFSRTDVAISGTKLSVDVSGAAFGYKVYNLDVTSAETNVKELKGGVKGLHTETGGLKNFIGALKNELDGTAAKARALEAKAGADVQGPPCSAGTN